MSKRAYLSGPMTGMPDLNFPAFHAAAADLRSRGVDVVNPAEINTDIGKSWKACLRADVAALCDCDAIVLLPGWERSNGAQLELHVAHRLGIEVEFYVEQPLRCDGCGGTVAEHGPLLRCPLAAPPQAAETVQHNGGKTGHPPGMLQDDSRKLTEWFAGRPDARLRVREAAAAIAAQAEPPQAAQPEAPDEGELEAWRSTADDLLRCTSSNAGLTRRAAHLLQDAYLFGSKFKAQPSPPADTPAEAQGEREAMSDEYAEHRWTPEQLNGIASAVHDHCGPATAQRVLDILAANERKTTP